MSEYKIAIVCEGKRPDISLLMNISNNYFSDSIIPVYLPIGMTVYMLWKIMEKDDFQTDIIEVIRESSELARKALQCQMRDDFSEVYIFLDYDVHSSNQAGSNADAKDILNNMLRTFDNETENGKLYINYPMVEAIRDLQLNDTCYRRCSTPINSLTKYKEQSSLESDFLSVKNYDKSCWKIICKHAVQKANCIIHSSFRIPTYNVFSNSLGQQAIFQKQYDKFAPDNLVPILSSMPLFLLEYKKEEFWNEMIRNNV